MSYSKDGKDWLGRDRVEHFDDKGNKVGTSKDGKDWLGKERTEHFDEKGNKVGVSKDGKDWLGNERAEHFDDSGKKTGTSKSEKDIFGNDIIQHYDNQGNKTKYTKAEKNWLGQTIFRHRTGGGSGDGIYGIIAVLIIIGLIVIAILGTFSYPYKLIDNTINPYSIDWLHNYNVWMFCSAFWILIITTILIIKSFITTKPEEFNVDLLFSNPLMIILLHIASLSVFTLFLIKSFSLQNELIISILISFILSGVYFLIIKKSKYKIYFVSFSILIFSISIYYILYQSNFQNSPISNNGYTITDEIAKSKLIEFGSIAKARKYNELNNVFSEVVVNYMGKANQQKASVVEDQINYAKRWQILDDSIIKFERKSPNEFFYIRKIKIMRTTNHDKIKNYQLEGVISFDADYKINQYYDITTKVIKEEVSEGLKSSNLFDKIIGGCWSDNRGSCVEIISRDSLIYYSFGDDYSEQTAYTIENNMITYGDMWVKTLVVLTPVLEQNGTITFSSSYEYRGSITPGETYIRCTNCKIAKNLFKH